MRPLRALLGLAVLIGLWLWWRAPAVRDELARIAAFAHLAQARVEMKGGGQFATLAEAHRSVSEPVAKLLLAKRSDKPGDRVPAAAAPAAIVASAERIETAALVAPDLTDRTSEDGPATEIATPSTDDAIAAYRLLSQGDRRAAVALFRSALAASPEDPRSPDWKRQLGALERRWSASAYVLARASGTGGLSAAPVLGGGQSGAQVVYFLDPLAQRPLAVEGRVSAPNDEPEKGAQAALGLVWRLTPSLSLTAERLFAAGSQARGGWTLRAAGGAATARPATARHWLDTSIYAESGVVRVRHPATYGAIQGRLGAATATGRLILGAGIGGWASVQHDAQIVSRVEIGPTVRVHAGALDLTADYRLRVAGNAAPGSGPALTLAAFF